MFSIGDKVKCRGQFAEQFSLFGCVEVLGTLEIGVRLQNGNFMWCTPDRIRPVK